MGACGRTPGWKCLLAAAAAAGGAAAAAAAVAVGRRRWRRGVGAAAVAAAEAVGAARGKRHRRVASNLYQACPTDDGGGGEWGDGVLAAGLEPTSPRALSDGGDDVGGRRERARGGQRHTHSMRSRRGARGARHIILLTTTLLGCEGAAKHYEEAQSRGG